MKWELTAKRFKEAMNNADMKAQEIANQTGLDKSSISQYISGRHKPALESAQKIGKILHVNPLWLMGHDVPMEREKEDISISKQRLIEAANNLTDEQAEMLLPLLNNLLGKN